MVLLTWIARVADGLMVHVHTQIINLAVFANPALPMAA